MKRGALKTISMVGENKFPWKKIVEWGNCGIQVPCPKAVTGASLTFSDETAHFRTRTLKAKETL